LGETRGGGKWHAIKPKSGNISETGKLRQRKRYHGGPIGSHQRFFEWCHPRSPWPFLPKIGVRNPHPKIQSQERTSRFSHTFTRSIRTKAHQNFWSEGNVGVSRDCPKLLCTQYPLLSLELVKLRTLNFVSTCKRSIGTKSH